MANYDFSRKRGEVVSEEEKKQRKITYDFTKPKPGTESLFKPETVSPVTVDTKFEQLMQPEVSVAPAVPKESAYTRLDQKLGGFLPFGTAIPKHEVAPMVEPAAVKPSPAIDLDRDWQEMVVQSIGQPTQDKQYSLDNPLLRALKLSTQDNIASNLASKIVEPVLGPDPTRIEPQTDFERKVQGAGGFIIDTAIGGKILEGFAPIVKGGLKKAVDMVKRMPLWAKATGGAAGTGAAVDTGIGAFTPDKEDRDFLQSVGASVRAGVGDTLALAGGIAKWKGKEGLGEALETKGAEIRRGFEDVSRVPEEEISWRSFFNPDFYSGNVARSLPTTLALVPAMFAGYKLGGAAGAKAGLGAFGRAVLGSLTGAGVSRPLESAMEAGAAYSEALERGYEPDKAEEIAQSIFDKNLRMWGLDAAQLAAAFVPAPFKPVGKLGKVAMGAGRLGGVGVVEGLEESAQEVFQQQAFGDDRGFIEQMLHPTQAQKEAAFVGGVFGVGMGGAGVVTDVMREIKTRTLETMPPEMQTEVRHHAEHLERNEGLTADESIDRALETIAETEEGQKVIDQAVQTVVDDVNSGRIVLPILGNIEPYSAPVVTEPVAAPVEPAAEVPASVSPVVTPTAALPEPAVATPAIVPEVTIPAPITPEPAGTAKVPEAVVHPAPVTPPAPVVESEPVTKAEAPTAPAEGKAIGKDAKQPKPAEAAKGPAPSPEFARTGEKVEIRVEVEPGKYKWEPATIERVVKNTKGEDLYEVRWNETVVRLNQDDVRPIKVDVTSKQKAPEAKTKQEPIPAEEKPTVVKRDRTTASTADLAADYKARGMSRQRAWSQFVIDKSLRPGIDAKEFYKVFDSVPLKLFKEVDVQGDVKATHILKETYTPERRVQILNETEGYVEWVDEHGTVGSTPREFIESLKSVSTEQETSTTNKKETRKRGFDKSPKEVLKEYGLQIVKTKDERDGRTAWQVKGKGARELKDVLKELGAKSINTSINEKAAWTFYGEEDPSVRILERVQQGATVTEPQSLEELQKQIIKASPGKIGKEKAEALGVLIRGVASYRGLDPDEYVRQRFRGVVLGGTPATDALLKRMAEDDKNMSMEPAAEDFTPPKKTIKAYKLFRTMKSQPGKIFPLFIGKSKPTPIGEWIEAEHIPTKGYAERPGWRAGILPYAPHLMKKDGTMQEGRVWAEVELPADVDWQPIADTTKTKDVRDRIPVGGHYRFKTNKMQGGAWIIGGAIKVNKILSPEEVREILKKGAPELLKTVEGVPVASVEFDEDARALIRALKAPDVAAMAHELGHVFRRDLSPGDLAIAEEWAGVEDGVWTQDAEEKFAEGFEKYLMDGKAPSPGLKQVFEKFKKWLTEIYKKLKNTQLSVELSDPMREVFDRLIGGKKLNVKLMGKTATAKTERGTAIEAQYAVVPAYELITSHNIDLSRNKAYPKELQPRQRERAASEDQINRIAANLEPEFLGESPKVSEGAPIVGEDMIVESGNGRVIALKRVYQKGDENADKYREWLVANAEKLGFNKEGFKEIENPILVRIRLTDVDRVKFTQEANEQTVAALSATEQAAVDSKKLAGDILNFFAPSETGEINTRANRDFIRLFVEKVVSPSDRGRFITSDGSLSQEGITRIRNAIYAKAYGDIAAIEKLAESTDNNVRNITNAMLMAAPKIAKVKEGIRKGSLYDLDISKDIADAMKKLSHLRESGTAVQDYLNQTALFGEDISPLAKDLLSAFDVNKRYVKRIAALLNNYADAVFSIGDPKQMSMFEASKPTKAEVLLTAIRKVAREYEGQISDQASLFQDEAVRGEADRGGIGEAHEKEGGSRQEEVSSYESAKAKLEAKTSEAIGDVNPPVGFSVRVVGGKGQAQADTGEFHIENEEIRDEAQAMARPATSPKLKKKDATKETIRRRDIVKFLDSKFAPIRTGRFRRKSLGIFKIKPEVIRTRLANDLPVICHEVGHYLDKKLNLADPAYDQELLNLGEPQSKKSYTKEQVRKEGVAEFMRLYLTEPETAKQEAPNYYAAFENKIEVYDDIKDSLLTTRADIELWYTQPAAARVAGAISVGESNRRKMSLSSIYALTIDELHPLKRYVEQIGAKNLPIHKDPFKLAWLARGWSGKARTLLYHGVLDANGKKIGKSLLEVLKPVSKELDDFRNYIVAKHSLEVTAQGKITGILDEDAQEVVDAAPDKYQKVLKDLVEYQDALLKLLVDSGVMSADAAKKMREMYPNYVPFYRVFEEDVNTIAAYMSKGGFANLRNPVKMMKGSTREILDPLESIVKNTYLFVNIAERNSVGRAIVELAESKEGSGRFVEKVDTRYNVAKENILTIYRDGKAEKYQLEPDLYRATLALDKDAANILVKILSYPASWLRAGATLSPDFILRNPFRDQYNAFINSKYGFIPGVDLIRGIFHYLKKDDLYWQFMNSGAASATLVSLDRDYLQKNVKELLKNKSKQEKILTALNPKEWANSFIEMLRELSEMGEYGTRIGEFAKGVRSGADPAEAALSARDVTLDFGRMGTHTKQANRIIAFMNATVQGMDKMRRQFIEKPLQTTLRAVISITLPSVLLFLANHDDDRYKELPQWQKDLFWIILTENNIYRIPKPFEMGILFGSVPERVLAWILENDPKAFDGIGETISEAALPGYIPTAMIPIIEAFANKSYFTGRPIVPQREEKLEPRYQYGPYTTETAKSIGNILNLSPRMIENFIRGYTGGLGMYSIKFAEGIGEVTGIMGDTSKPSLSASEYPVLKAFMAKEYINSQSVQDFYDELNELERKYATTNQTGKAHITLKEHARLKKLRKVAGKFSDIRKVEREILGSETLTPEQKKAALDRANLLMVNMAREALGRRKVQ